MHTAPIVVAHRAGNKQACAADAQERADMVELDLHVFRGRVEVRHEKVLWPTSRLWERWKLFPPGHPVSTIDEILAVIEPDTPLLLDLKCFTPWTGRRIRRAIPEAQPAVAACRSWWVLRAFRDRPNTALLRSCGTSRQLWLALRVPGLGERLGIVAHEEILDREALGAVRAKTPLLYSWAIKTAGRGRELAAAGVRGLIVDDLDLDWPRTDGLP